MKNIKDFGEIEEVKMMKLGENFDHTFPTHKTEFDKEIRETYNRPLNEQEIIHLQTINPALRGKVSGKFEDTGQRIARKKRECHRAKSAKLRRK